MARICGAMLLIRSVPFARWRGHLGLVIESGERRSIGQARDIAADVEWAANRLPFPAKCLPRAMALSWMLRRWRIGHAVVIAVRPSQLRRSTDALHAWVEVEGQRVLGDLPGPWAETARFGA
jgi:hypothetical protein